MEGGVTTLNRTEFICVYIKIYSAPKPLGANIYMCMCVCVCVYYVCMYTTKPTRTQGDRHGQLLDNAQTKLKHVIALTKPTAKLTRVTALTKPTRTQS